MVYGGAKGKVKMMKNSEDDDFFGTGPGYNLKQEKIGFWLALVVLSAMAGSVVGTIWALAVGAKVLLGIMLGVLINIIVWSFAGYTATVNMHIPCKQASATLGTLVYIANILVGILGLVVWLIRAVAKQ